MLGRTPAERRGRARRRCAPATRPGRRRRAAAARAPAGAGRRLPREGRRAPDHRATPDARRPARAAACHAPARRRRPSAATGSRRVLGRGGMGIVYEAEEIESGRRVALKVLEQRLDDARERERFEREGRLAASINHEHCVFVFGAAEIDGMPAIAMELMQGTLADRLAAAGPLPPAAAVDAALQLVAGLQAAPRPASSTATSSRRTASSTPTASSRSATSASRARCGRPRRRRSRRATSSRRRRPTPRRSSCAAPRSTCAPTSTASARRSTSCSPAAGRSPRPI